MTGHQVRTTVGTDQRISSVLFMRQNGVDETRKLPECIVVDANPHKMAFQRKPKTANYNSCCRMLTR